MIIEQKTEKIYHENGQLSYTETIGVLSTSHAHLYDKRRLHPDGYEWVRIGYNAKFNDKGKMIWQLHYSLRGEILK